MSLQKRNSLLLVLTAFIWGVAFVAQSTGGDAVGPYSFNCIRFLIGSVVLIPVYTFMDRKNLSTKKPVTPKQKKELRIAGICCGLCLCVASNLQQVGITMGTSAGKAGFITACYILLVPILGLFLKKKCGLNIWIGVFLTLGGLYLLCINGAFRLQLSDILLILCALMFSIHILVIDHFSPLVDNVRLSSIQFFIAGIFSAIPMFLSDMNHSFANLSDWLSGFQSLSAWIAILYAGVLSSGVAYTLQIVGQNGVNPTVASLLMSLESVFSVLAGFVLLGEKLSEKELLGCLLIFVAVCLAQIDFGTKPNNS